MTQLSSLSQEDPISPPHKWEDKRHAYGATHSVLVSHIVPGGPTHTLSVVLQVNPVTPPTLQSVSAVHVRCLQTLPLTLVPLHENAGAHCLSDVHIAPSRP